jgi:hypothetical protein
MGRKQTWSGKYFYVCLTLLIAISVVSCALPSSRKDVDDPRLHIAMAHKFLEEGNYEESVRENQKALFLSANESPGDEALLNIALVYANPANPHKDYTQSIMSLTLLTKDYPQSPLADQARVWTEVLQENAKLKRASQEVLQENAKLKRASQEAHHEVVKLKRASQEVLQENAKLKRVIEESKKVDLEITEMRRKK